ncbi:hypothetical protein MHM88_14435 [Epibacterium sp. MM17-32]|uniref:hypothetical protein n=1 Tax=Epibacterium sp. MM17-32 TaxID=2917734 RepID=UPI001EF4BFE6|nr:hypothetical protein [Epibacterium sp. MM17-32]MCG7629006.1 hypothetical protein [Epibacterium sp. MM17-32]
MKLSDNTNLVSGIAHAITKSGKCSGDLDMIEEVVGMVLDTLVETQITTYTFPDPEGVNYCHGDLDDVAMGLDLLDTGNGQQWPIHMQIEMREPVCSIQFVNDQAVLLK